MILESPEIGRTITAADIRTNYHDQGEGAPVLLIHGSGPGVNAWTNWRLTLSELAKEGRVIAPDMVGFGFTERPEGFAYGLDNWVDHVVGLLDVLGIERTDLVGNSFGGAVALALAIRHPARVGRLVLMGSLGVAFPITPGLDAVWGYQPSLAAMRGLQGLLAYAPPLMTDEQLELRHQATLRAGVQESFAAMFPVPRQRWIDAVASDEANIAALPHETLIIHGRDDRIIPLENSLRLHQLIDRSQLHVFGRCGHLTQIEHADRFNRLVGDFLAE